MIEKVFSTEATVTWFSLRAIAIRNWCVCNSQVVIILVIIVIAISVEIVVFSLKKL